MRLFVDELCPVPSSLSVASSPGQAGAEVGLEC